MNEAERPQRRTQRVRIQHRENDTGSSPVIYGHHPVSELLSSRPQAIEKVLLEAQRNSPALFDILKQARKLRIPTQMVPAQRLDDIAQSNKHQGVVAMCSVKPYATKDEILEKVQEAGQSALLVVPASIEDPRNLGSLIRSSVAFGVDCILLEKKNTAPLSPVAAKTSAGMIEHITIGKPRNLEGMLRDMAARGFAIVGAEMSGDTTVWETNLTGPTVLIMGGENKGIPPYLSKLCTHLVRIPLHPECSSLNVSAAATIMLYETARQREQTS